MIEIKEVVEYLVKLIVDKPEEVEISEKRGEQVIIFEVRANKQDFGKILVNFSVIHELPFFYWLKNCISNN
jgi:hypothetical protein